MRRSKRRKMRQRISKKLVKRTKLLKRPKERIPKDCTWTNDKVNKTEEWGVELCRCRPNERISEKEKETEAQSGSCERSAYKYWGAATRFLWKWLRNESHLEVRKPWGHSEVPGPVQRTIRWVSLAINKDLRLVHHDLQLWVILHGHGGRGCLKRRDDRDVYGILDWIRLRRSSYSAIQIKSSRPYQCHSRPQNRKKPC